jgi:signal transduction histidine kinase
VSTIGNRLNDGTVLVSGVKKAVTNGHGGTGLDLYMTRKIIQKHGGTIAVHSKKGKGSRCEIALPRKPFVPTA